MLTQTEAAALLSLLCTRLGFCLPSDANVRLTEAPPPDVPHFTEAVFLAEGLDPVTADRKLYRQVKAVVAEAFRRSEEREADTRLKELLLSAAPQVEIPVPPRGSRRRREPPALD
jgi:hypothetical protein